MCHPDAHGVKSGVEWIPDALSCPLLSDEEHYPDRKWKRLMVLNRRSGFNAWTSSLRKLIGFTLRSLLYVVNEQV